MYIRIHIYIYVCVCCFLITRNHHDGRGSRTQEQACDFVISMLSGARNHATLVATQIVDLCFIATDCGIKPARLGSWQPKRKLKYSCLMISVVLLLQPWALPPPPPWRLCSLCPDPIFCLSDVQFPRL